MERFINQLKKVGYNVHDKTNKRHKTLNKACYSKRPRLRYISRIYNSFVMILDSLDKNDPMYEIYKSDCEFVHKKHVREVIKNLPEWYKKSHKSDKHIITSLWQIDW